MRMGLLAIFLRVGIGLTAQDPEAVFAVDAYLPHITNEWERREDAGTDAVHSWVNFENSRKPEEVLAIVFWKVPTSVSLIGGPVGQASIEMFLSDGSARMSSKQGSDPIAEMLRYRTVPITIKSKALERTIELIEYTYVYEGKPGAPGNMAHGYCFVEGETATFVQHTAPHPITSQLAFDVASGCMINLLGLSDKASTVDKGKVLQSFD